MDIGQYALLAPIIIAVTDAIKREWSEIAKRDLRREAVIAVSAATGIIGVTVYEYWDAFPAYVQVPLTGLALGLVVNGVIKGVEYAGESFRR